MLASKYFDIFLNGFSGYWNYLVYEITHPAWNNYFWWLIAVSLFFFVLEVIVPWRKNQPLFRKDFWQDAFYMFFSFFIFSLIGYNAISDVFVQLFKDFLALFGVSNLVAIEVNSWPVWGQLLTLFILRDFVHFNVHRLLHTVPWLWEFHKVHHSVREMGFAAHLRYHFMETVVYRFIEYLPLAMIGFSISDFFVVHIFSLAIGHLNHSNLNIDFGPFRYLLNNPKMHIWHHAKELPKEHGHGVNFGITLSIWDYMFRTNYIPHDGRDIPLGFEDVEKFPDSFVEQQLGPFRRHKTLDANIHKRKLVK
ncbi:sterol desaturase family protein [Porifericola rhodea]|uniref:sterol desaturase family protein n=1 Tax=Porifericola rhodea TaxID=930972 RepID=UPI0026670B94|nr:sterol desaturase family protein [Porifericola rhodea]WKN32698.1 sterol desaturase family protein [Porifericola rhodea]